MSHIVESGDESEESESIAQAASDPDQHETATVALPLPADVTSAATEAADLRAQIEQGCGCAGDKNHWDVFDPDRVLEFQSSMARRSKMEKDMYICGVLSACSCVTESTRSGRSERAGRHRITSEYNALGHVVCRNVFMAVYGLGHTHLERLRATIREKKYLPAPHGPWTY